MPVGKLQRRFMILLTAGAAAFACWKSFPGTGIDRALFGLTCRAIANPPFFVSGGGTPKSPWALRTFSPTEKMDPRQAPVMIALGDDPENVFQSSPPSPVDMAVVFSNFQRLGAKNAACAVVLAWERPDPIGLAALDKVIAGFDHLVMTAPLSRGAVPEPIPPSFRRASIPLDRITGDRTALPIVNRIPIPGVILGGEQTKSGFQCLDFEMPDTPSSLLAVWEDRVVISFPLLAVMQRMGVDPEDLEVHLGSHVKLGKLGPSIPIDRFGRLSLPIRPAKPLALIPAESLIDAKEDLIPSDAIPPVILCDTRSGADLATQAFTRNLAGQVTAFSSEGGLTETTVYNRWSPRGEIMYLAMILLAAVWVCGFPPFGRKVSFALIAGFCVCAQVIAAGMEEIWLPSTAALVGLVCVTLLDRLLPASHVRVKHAPPKVRTTPSKRAPKSVPDAAPTDSEPPPGPSFPAERKSPAPSKPSPKTPPAKKAARKSKKRRR